MGQSTANNNSNKDDKSKDTTTIAATDAAADAAAADSSSSMIMVNRKCVLIKAPDDHQPFVAAVHSVMETETINGRTTCLAPDHVIVQIQTITIDAFIRVMLHPIENKIHGAIQVGQVIPAVAVGTIVQSNSRKFPVGRTVSGLLGGQSYATVPDSELMSVLSIPGIPRYTMLNLLGLSGLTAYVGIYCVAPSPPRRGETVVVTAAAGATGSIAAQLAKRRGARVIGVAGGTEKCLRLVQEMGLDGAIDYKNVLPPHHQSLHDQFVEQCPNGIDFLYDNVGGECLNEALLHMTKFSRVVICGAISQYNTNKINHHTKIETKQDSSGSTSISSSSGGAGPSNYIRLAEQSATMAGFVVIHHPLGMLRAILHLTWIYFWGQVKSFEQVYHGIDEFPKALQALYEGGNVGKPIIALD